jgi:hypothetical protein
MDEMPNSVSPELISFIQNDPRNENGKYFCEIYDDIFLHYRAGGNWLKEGMTFHKELTNKLRIVLTSTEK